MYTTEEAIANFWSKVQRTDKCWLWLGHKTDRGYGDCYFKGKLWKAHRLAWVLSGRTIPEGKKVLHHCDNPPCVNPRYLWTGTQQDNMDDCRERGRIRLHQVAYIKRDCSVKLTPTKVRQIRKQHASGITHVALAKIHRVATVTIQKVCLGITWRHVAQWPTVL